MWKLITAELTLQPYLLQRSSRPCSYRQPEHSELTATAALNQLGSFANHLASVQAVILNHIIAEHYAEHRLVVINRTYHADHVLWQCLANLEYQILGSCWLHWQYGCNNLHTVDFFCILYKLILGTLYSLSWNFSTSFFKASCSSMYFLMTPSRSLALLNKPSRLRWYPANRR